MSEYKRFFTIQTINGSGLGDQLGTQFSRLFGLGNALGAYYRYTPVSFHRSIKPRWYELSQSILFRLRYLFFFYIGQNLLSSAVNIIFLRLEKRFDAGLKKFEDNDLSEFLGLKYINEGDNIELENSSFCDIYMDDFFESSLLFQFSDFQEYVDTLMKDKMNSTILRFNWTGKMWALIPKIDQLIKDAGLDRELILQTTFSNSFWKQHAHTFSNKTNIVFHIRCGDSTTVRLGERTLIVYDKFLYTSENEMKDILAIDPDRISVLPNEYIQIYEQIITEVGLNKISLTVISDGFDLTYKNLLRNLLKRKCLVILTKQERKILSQKIKGFNIVFNHFDQAKLIIGESNQNLQESIYALANADVVIWGCGGFACNTHYLFKGSDKKSMVINVKNFSESKINLINELNNG